MNANYKFRRIEAANAPLARSSHGMSSFKEGPLELLIVFGGEYESRKPIDSVLHLFDLKRLQWERVELPDAPVPRIAHAQAVLDGSLFVFGGRKGVDEKESSLNDFWEWSIKERSWKQLKTTVNSSPSKRSFHRMTTAEGKLYMFGGCGEDGRLADLWEFDGKQWRELASAPMDGRGGATFFALGKYLLVVGGFSGRERSDVWAYSIAANSWKQVHHDQDQAFRARSVTAYGEVGSQMVVFGGEVDPSSKGHAGAGGFLNDVVVIRAESNGKIAIETHAAQKSFPMPRGWGAACGIGNNKLAIFGGLTGTDEEPKRLDDLWILELD
jgi:N-acetylneuraminic acid mutarotase